MALIPTFLRGFLRGFLRVRVSSKELTQMEIKLNEVLEKNFDCERDVFIQGTYFIPAMQNKVNQMLNAEYSLDKANRVAELSVLLDKLQTYRTEPVTDLKLVYKKPIGGSLLSFRIIKIHNPKAFKSKAVIKAKQLLKNKNDNEKGTNI